MSAAEIGAVRRPGVATAPQPSERRVAPSVWYVVYTKPRQEEVALRNLLNQGYEAWLPMHTGWRRKDGRWQVVRCPLFPRYAFGRPGRAGQGTGPIRSTLGVLGLVRFGGVPATVRQALVDELHAVEARLAASVTGAVAPFRPGQSVRVVSGPFAGLEGVVARTAKARVAVLLEMLGREQRVQFDAGALAVRGA